MDALPTPQIAEQVRESLLGVASPDVFCVLMVVAFLLLWAGSSPVISAWADRSRRPALAQRLASCQSVSVAGEAERWLGEEAACGG